MSLGQQILQFSLSLNALDRRQLGEVCGVIAAYTRDALDIDSTKIFVETTVDGVQALSRHDLDGMDTEIVERVRGAGGEYRGQAALSYDRRKPTWVVSRTGQQRLETCDAVVDLWSGLRKIPAYRPRKDDAESQDPVKTSICIPLCRRRSGQVFGVVNFRTGHFVDITEEAKSELERLSGAFAHLVRTFQAQSVLDKSTSQAIGLLELEVSRRHPRLTKPVVFVASSSEADDEVMASILRVLETRQRSLDVVFWERMDRPGNIMVQLLETIALCRYGIAYFSQKAAEGDGYVDNSNVVFEAGMFHGRVSRHAGASSPWIAIREESSPPMFFDLAQERILPVNRNRDGSLAVGPFEKAVASRLEAMMAPEER